MIHDIVLAVTAFLKINAERTCQFAQFRELACQAECLATERVHVGGHALDRVAPGIHADEHDPWQLGLSQFSKLLPGVDQRPECQRANVGTLGETEKNEVPLAPEDTLGDRLASLVKQLERRQFKRGRQDGCAVKLRDAVLPLYGQKDTAGEGGAKQYCDDKILDTHRY
jgi:hypothetical protein